MARPTPCLCVSFLLLCLPLCLQAAPIHEAAKRGDLGAVQGLLAADPALLEATDEVGYTPLNWAAMRGKWDLVRDLVGRGANVNAAGRDGCASLHCAANEENPEMLALLLSKGAELEARNAWGNTPLQMAVQRGNAENVRAFLEHGADLQTASDEGWTPLHYASKSGHEEVRRILLAAGASDEVLDGFGRRPSDYVFTKPPAVDLPRSTYGEYVGDYAFGGGFFAKVWEEDGRLMLEDFAHDEIYPIGWDHFYSKQHPWAARFYRDARGRVDKIALVFQRQTVVGKKVESRDAPVSRPVLGVRPRELREGDLSAEQLAHLMLVEKAGPHVPVLEFVQEDSPAGRAGLRAGDVLLEFAQQKLVESGDLTRLLLDAPPGQEVPVRILREGRFLNVTIPLD